MLRNLIIEALQAKTNMYDQPIWKRLEHYIAWSHLLDKCAITDTERHAVQKILDAWYKTLDARYELADQNTVVMRIIA